MSILPPRRKIIAGVSAAIFCIIALRLLSAETALGANSN